MASRGPNIMITHDGITQCAAKWAEQLGITRQAMHIRLQKWGLPRAVTEPKNEGKHVRV